VQSASRWASVAVAIALGIAGVARAAIVSGNFHYQNGAPAPNRHLHLENRATGDMFVAPTESDGNFSAQVPPGTYDLRAERGVILKYRIEVDSGDINVGRVLEPVPLDVHRIFQHEGVAKTIVESAAPSTASMSGRPVESMRFGHAAVEPLGAPVGTPQAISTPQIGLPGYGAKHIE
jgi:hypothetical protein